MYTRCTRDIDMMCYSFKIEEPAVQELSQQIDKYLDCRYILNVIGVIKEVYY